jgi:hypothetical protein
VARLWTTASEPSQPHGKRKRVWQIGSAGSCSTARSRYAEAEPLYKRAIAIDEKALGLDHPDVGSDLSDLASGSGYSASIQQKFPKQCSTLPKLARLYALTCRPPAAITSFAPPSLCFADIIRKLRAAILSQKFGTSPCM